MAKAAAYLDDTTAFVLAAELRALLGRLKRRLREQADVGDLTPSQAAALSRLDRDGPATLSALARAEGIRSQSMAATIAALQSAGLVSAAPDPADGRQAILTVTRACQDWIAAGRALRQDWLTRVIAREFDPRERDKLAEAIKLLRRIANA